MINLMLIDDHAMFRSGLKKVFLDEPQLRVLDDAGDWAEGLEKLRRLPELDVLLLDINLPARSGLELLDLIRAEFPRLRVVMLSMYSQQQYAVRALRAGADGYVAKDMEAADLITAINTVVKGRKYMSPTVMDKLIATMNGPEDEPVASKKLSLRESQILQLLIEGQSLTNIGARLGISVKTVSTYRSRILDKKGVSTNAELIQYAMRNHLVD